ncbi:hypothetical protein VPNG_05146 [Cytospora leucostoma]|uniref:SUR7 protein n=1 Tax=Cytospora leucostoma TaxID=1230097 RepID=A0A423X4K0_9PEZI|nr:hypothetical protein VPNG_05146 [Cytospora leucostoma]
MRFSALGPFILGLGALVLTLLCLFAGSTKSFLTDYSLITVNTSQIGSNLLDSSYVNSNSQLSDIIDALPSDIKDDADALLNTVIRQLGIHDFYSANLMTYCEGYYEPAAVPNATVTASSITKNVTYCSPRTADFQFDPRAALQRDLDASGNSWLDASADLDWPDKVEEGIDAVHVVQRAAFILYCIATGLCGLSAIASLLTVFASSGGGRACACGDLLLAALAFLAALAASALATAVAEVGARAVDQYGGQVGISAGAGRRFMGLTWGATGAMLVCVVWWSVDCCCCCCGGGGRRKGGRKAGAFGRGEKMGKYDSGTSV